MNVAATVRRTIGYDYSAEQKAVFLGLLRLSRQLPEHAELLNQALNVLDVACRQEHECGEELDKHKAGRRAQTELFRAIRNENWRTLDTAPADGTSILICGGLQRISRVAHADGDYWRSTACPASCKPARWQPLPDEWRQEDD